MSVIGGRPRAGISAKIASGAAKEACRSPLYLNPTVGTGLGLVCQGSRTGHFVMFILSYKARAAYGGCAWEAEGAVQGL